MKRIIFSIMMLIFLAPMSVFADIAPDPGFHEVCSYVYIDNLDEYPDFDIYATKYWRFGSSATEAQGLEGILDTECYGHGSDTSEPFFAIKTSDQMYIVNEINDERGDNWDILTENERYFIYADIAGSSKGFGDELTKGVMSDSNPVVTNATIYHINQLDAESFRISVVNEKQYDANQELISEILSEDSDDTALPVLSIIIVMLGVIILFFTMRKWKK